MYYQNTYPGALAGAQGSTTQSSQQTQPQYSSQTTTERTSYSIQNHSLPPTRLNTPALSGLRHDDSQVPTSRFQQQPASDSLLHSHSTPVSRLPTPPWTSRDRQESHTTSSNTIKVVEDRKYALINETETERPAINSSQPPAQAGFIPFYPPWARSDYGLPQNEATTRPVPTPPVQDSLSLRELNTELFGRDRLSEISEQYDRLKIVQEAAPAYSNVGTTPLSTSSNAVQVAHDQSIANYNYLKKDPPAPMIDYNHLKKNPPPKAASVQKQKQSTSTMLFKPTPIPPFPTKISHIQPQELAIRNSISRNKCSHISASQSNATKKGVSASDSSAKSAQQKKETSILSTEFYEGCQIKGPVGHAMEEEGAEELQEYKKKVVELLAKASHNCLANYQWFNMSGGWICGGGTHFIHRNQIEGRIRNPDIRGTPSVAPVNTQTGNAVWPAAHPPPVAYHLPMHKAHRDYIQGHAKSGSVAWSLECCKQVEQIEQDVGEPCTCVQSMGMPVIDNTINMQRAMFTRYSHQGLCIVGPRGCGGDYSMGAGSAELNRMGHQTAEYRAFH